jgi:Xaa-Pro dipeptidase
MLERFELNGLLISGGSLNYRFADDTTYPFRLNPYLARFAPLQNFPNSWLFISLNSDKPVLVLYEPQDFWHKVESLECSSIVQEFDVHITTSKTEQLTWLNGLTGNIAAIGDEAEFSAVTTTLIKNPKNVVSYLDYHCGVKSDYELSCLSEANQLGAKAHSAAKVAFFAGNSEYDIHRAYLEAISAEDHQLPYDSIVALNTNAATLHYTHRDRTAPSDSLTLLIDAGACFLGYDSDITRTYCQSESGVFADLITELDAIQQTLIAGVKPNVDYASLHQQTHLEISRLLVNTNLVTCSENQAIEQQLSSTFFPHGLGHFLGVQVHDKGGWLADDTGSENPPPSIHPFLRLTRKIEQGQVFTIEPGLYFIPILLKKLRASEQAKYVNWELVEQLLPYGGIRIEDNIAVTETGARNLTREYLPD